MSFLRSIFQKDDAVNGAAAQGMTGNGNVNGNPPALNTTAIPGSSQPGSSNPGFGSSDSGGTLAGTGTGAGAPNSPEVEVNPPVIQVLPSLPAGAPPDRLPNYRPGYPTMADYTRTSIQERSPSPERTAAAVGLPKPLPNFRAEQDLEALKDNVKLVSEQLHFLLRKGETEVTLARLLNQLTSRLRAAQTVEQLFTTVVAEMREALGADRVIIYTFDAQWRGTIVAESVGQGWKTALGDQIADPCFADRYVEPYRRGRVAATPNIHTAGLTECHLKQLAPYGVQANLVAPILSNQNLHGLLIVHQCSRPRNWDEWEIDFASQLAAQVGYAYDQITLLSRQSASAAVANRLNQITFRLRESLKPEDIFATVVVEIRESLSADRVVVCTFDPQWQGTFVAESLGRGWKASLGDQVYDPCFSERYIESYRRGQVTAINNVQTAGLTDCYLHLLAPYQVQANLVAPVLFNQKLYGLLIAHQCSGPRQWQEPEMYLLQQTAVQVGFALEQAQILDQQRTAASRAQALSQISTRLRRAQTQKEAVDLVVEEARVALDCDRVIIYPFDANWQGTVAAESVVQGFRVSYGDTSIDPCFAERYVKLYQRGQHSAIEDIQAPGLAECHRQQLLAYDVKASLVVPILANRQLFGLLITHQCRAPRQWQQPDIDFCRQIASQVGFAIDQLQILEQQQATALQAQQLNQIVSEIRKTLTPEHVFTATVEAMQAVLQADRVLVYTFDPKWQGTIVAEAVLPEYPEALGAMIADPCFADQYVRQYQRGRVKATEDIHQAGLTECHLQQLAPFQVRANLVAPILADQKLYGLLIAHQCSGPRLWQSSEIEFFRQVAIQVGFALEQALTLKNAQVARQIAEEFTERQRQQTELLQQQIQGFLTEIKGSFTGDLTVRATVGAGEMGTVADFFNVTIESLQRLVLEVQAATADVAQVSRDSEQQVAGVSADGLRQSRSLAQALTKIQSMASLVQGMAVSAQQAQLKVQEGSQLVSNSDQSLNTIVGSIQSVQQTVEKATRKVKRLAEASQNISRIVGIIGEIARQTNILSLNAAIEPRLGTAEPGLEAGAGFTGLVSVEVGYLAEQSADAAREIEQIVSQIQTEASEAVATMETSQQLVNQSSETVAAARQQLQQINTASQQIQELVTEIACQANLEVQTSQELSQTMQEVAGIAQQTSRQSGTLAESLHKLATVTESLQARVAQFKVV